MCRKFTIKVCNFIMESSINDVGLSIAFEKFEHKLSNYLKHYRTVAVTEKQFHWDAICDFVRLHINELYYQKNASIFCNYVIELLLEFDCPSKFFVSRITDIYCICNCITYLDQELSRISKISENLHVVLEFLKSRFSQQHTRDSFRDQCRKDYVYTLKGIRKGNMKFMRLLLKYDCTSISPMSNYPDITREYSVEKIKHFDWEIRLTILGEVSTRRLARPEHFIDKWSTVSWPDCAVSKPRFGRMILILKGVDALVGQLLGTEENSEKLDCFRLYVESTRYPFLTLPEFRGFLIVLSKFLRLENAVNVVQMCDAFGEVYPECDAFYQPRTLKDLCRCGVRRSYRKYGSLPFTLQKLHVPTTLKNYILFQ